LLGVALMIGGILGSMCFAGVGSESQLIGAGCAIALGAVLVAVGFMRGTRT
jgi:hypothetical protein